jgi:hypothetical protein
VRMSVALPSCACCATSGVGAPPRSCVIWRMAASASSSPPLKGSRITAGTVGVPLVPAGRAAAQAVVAATATAVMAMAVAMAVAMGVVGAAEVAMGVVGSVAVVMAVTMGVAMVVAMVMGMAVVMVGVMAMVTTIKRSALLPHLRRMATWIVVCTARASICLSVVTRNSPTCAPRRAKWVASVGGLFRPRIWPGVCAEPCRRAFATAPSRPPTR